MKSVLTEFTRRLKDFTGFSVLTEHSRLTQEIIFGTQFTVLGWPVKDLLKFVFQPTVVMIYFQSYLSRLDNLKGIYIEIFKL